MRDHGGDIVIRNMPGKGCVFVIDLPLQREDDGAAGPEAAAPSA